METPTANRPVEFKLFDTFTLKIKRDVLELLPGTLPRHKVRILKDKLAKDKGLKFGFTIKKREKTLEVTCLCPETAHTIDAVAQQLIKDSCCVIALKSDIEPGQYLYVACPKQEDSGFSLNDNICVNAADGTMQPDKIVTRRTRIVIPHPELDEHVSCLADCVSSPKASCKEPSETGYQTCEDALETVAAACSFPPSSVRELNVNALDSIHQHTVSSGMPMRNDKSQTSETISCKQLAANYSNVNGGNRTNKQHCASSEKINQTGSSMDVDVIETREFLSNILVPSTENPFASLQELADVAVAVASDRLPTDSKYTNRDNSVDDDMCSIHSDDSEAVEYIECSCNDLDVDPGPDAEYRICENHPNDCTSIVYVTLDITCMKNKIHETKELCHGTAQDSCDHLQEKAKSGIGDSISDSSKADYTNCWRMTAGKMGQACSMVNQNMRQVSLTKVTNSAPFSVESLNVLTETTDSGASSATSIQLASELEFSPSTNLRDINDQNEWNIKGTPEIMYNKCSSNAGTEFAIEKGHDACSIASDIEFISLSPPPIICLDEEDNNNTPGQESVTKYLHSTPLKGQDRVASESTVNEFQTQATLTGSISLEETYPAETTKVKSSSGLSTDKKDNQMHVSGGESVPVLHTGGSEQDLSEDEDVDGGNLYTNDNLSSARDGPCDIYPIETQENSKAQDDTVSEVRPQPNVNQIEKSDMIMDSIQVEPRGIGVGTMLTVVDKVLSEAYITRSQHTQSEVQLPNRELKDCENDAAGDIHIGCSETKSPVADEQEKCVMNPDTQDERSEIHDINGNKLEWVLEKDKIAETNGLDSSHINTAIEANNTGLSDVQYCPVVTDVPGHDAETQCGEILLSENSGNIVQLQCDNNAQEFTFDILFQDANSVTQDVHTNGEVQTLLPITFNSSDRADLATISNQPETSEKGTNGADSGDKAQVIQTEGSQTLLTDQWSGIPFTSDNLPISIVPVPEDPTGQHLDDHTQMLQLFANDNVIADATNGSTNIIQYRLVQEGDGGSDAHENDSSLQLDLSQLYQFMNLSLHESNQTGETGKVVNEPIAATMSATTKLTGTTSIPTELPLTLTVEAPPIIPDTTSSTVTAASPLTMSAAGPSTVPTVGAAEPLAIPAAAPLATTEASPEGDISDLISAASAVKFRGGCLEKDMIFRECPCVQQMGAKHENRNFTYVKCDVHDQVGNLVFCTRSTTPDKCKSQATTYQIQNEGKDQIIIDQSMKTLVENNVNKWKSTVTTSSIATRKAVPSSAGKQFNRSKLTKEHVREDDGIFGCKSTGCDYKSVKLDYMRRHVTHKHTQKRVVCEACGKSYCTVGRLKAHLRKKKACQASMATAKLSNTIKVQHLDQLYLLETESVNRAYNCVNDQYFCRKCTFASAREGEMHVHIRVEHPNPTQTCPVCCKMFTSLETMNLHFRYQMKTALNRYNWDDINMFTSTKDEFYNCNSCPYSTSFHSLIYHHVLLVHGDETFQCPNCEYSMATIDSLDSHIKKHKLQNRVPLVGSL